MGCRAGAGGLFLLWCRPDRPVVRFAKGQAHGAALPQMQVYPSRLGNTAMSRVRNKIMIRNVIICLLSIASLGVIYVTVISFARDGDRAEHVVLHGADWTLLDLDDSAVFIEIDCGSASLVYARYGASLKQSSCFRTKTLRRLVTLIAMSRLSCKGTWKNMFRFGADDIRQPGNTSADLPRRYQQITFPLWCPLLLVAAYPTLAFIRGPIRRHRRRKRNECIHCGYSLTGLTESRCPECGKAK